MPSFPLRAQSVGCAVEWSAVNVEADLGFGARSSTEQADAVTAVARVARALVGARGLRALGGDALSAISEALSLNVVAMYLPDPDGSPVLRLFEVWPEGHRGGRVAEVLPLGPETWHFLASSVGPLVLRQRDAVILDNPFMPPADSWVVLPLLGQDTIEGAVFGSSSAPIALGPLMRATLGSIADLLSAGVATAKLRLEAQRMEIHKERLSIVAELHDGLAQDLALAVREVAFLESEPAAEAARASTQRLSEAVRAAHRVVRAELEDLAANVSEPGADAAVRSIVDRFAQRGLSVQLEEPVSHAMLSPSSIAVLVRVLTEALTNVQKHADTADAIVTLRTESEMLVLRVEDDGAGIDTQRLPTVGDGHFGLAIMRARALSVGGTLAITGARGVGTIVELRLPPGWMGN